MKQQTLAMAADQSYENYRKPTLRNEFLKPMEAIVPWASLRAVIEPHYPKAGNGRPPIGLERMLHIHFIQHWSNLADMAYEDALYDRVSLRRFVGIDLGREAASSGLCHLHVFAFERNTKGGQHIQTNFWMPSWSTLVTCAPTLDG